MTLEMRGMRRSDIVDYFIYIGGKEEDNGRFLGQGWEVIIGEENLAKLGSLRIPATKVTFLCEGELLDRLVYDFRLRFMSAGG